MVIVLMGVSGSGKTSIGKRLAGHLGWQFYDGDDFHPTSNIDKMQQGIPLTDEDRQPWLAAMRNLIEDLVRREAHAVLACSALKKSYREFLLVDPEHVHFVYLKGDIGLIRQRLQSRGKHFMKPGMLPSQFEALEEPEGVLVVDISQPPSQIVRFITHKLGI